MANVNNYIAAGKAAVSKNLSIRKALSDNKADYGALGQETIKAERDKKIKAIQANAYVANQATKAATQVEGAKIAVDRDKSIAASKRSARKAGMLAGGAALLGAGAMRMNKKHEPDSMLAEYKGLIDKNSGRLSAADQRIEDARSKLNSFQDKPSSDSSTPSPDTTTTPAPEGTSTLGDSSSIFQQAANITGKYESDSAGGYNAYNLGGSDGGHTAHGSGNSSDGKQFGNALTSMTIGQIKGLQSSGKLHAAGRFQFIGNSLPEAAQFAGLDDNSLFTPENQNKMFMAFGQKYGSGRWVGLSNASAEERGIVDQAFSSWNR